MNNELDALLPSPSEPPVDLDQLDADLAAFEASLDDDSLADRFTWDDLQG